MARRRASAPSRGLWIAALVIGILGIVSHFVFIETLSEYSVWLIIIGFALLAIGTSFKNI